MRIGTKAFLLSAVIISVIFTAPLLAQVEKKGLEVSCCFPAQVTVGKDSRVVVISKAFSAINSIKIDPAENITVKKIGDAVSSDYEKKEGKKRWEIFLFADKKAKCGERGITFVTPEGNSEVKKIKVIPYEPVITGIKVLSTKSSNWQVEFIFYVNYPGKSLGAKPELTIQTACGVNATMTIREAIKAVNKGKGKWEVQGKVDNPMPNAFCKGPAEISFSIEDKNGYRSGFFTHKFEFK